MRGKGDSKMSVIHACLNGVGMGVGVGEGDGKGRRRDIYNMRTC